VLRLFADDVVFIKVVGMKHKGLAAVELEFQWLHGGMMRNTHCRMLERDIRILAPGVAVAHVNWEMTGAESLHGWTPSEVRRGEITDVLVETRQGWRVTTFQNTEVVPVPGVS
jgi:uncharacterized protein (TIGR02246 family)